MRGRLEGAKAFGSTLGVKAAGRRAATSAAAPSSRHTPTSSPTKWTTGSAWPPSLLPRAAKPLALAPRFTQGAGGRQGNPQPPSCAAPASSPARRPALLCFSREEASYNRTKQARGRNARWAAAPPARQRDPPEAPYLRELSVGTEPCSEHRPRPPLAVPSDPNNRPVAERSRARSGTSPPCSPPAPTSWWGTAVRGVPGIGGPRGGRAGSSPARRGSTASATCAGNLTPRRSPEFLRPDVTLAEEWLRLLPSQGARDGGPQRASALPAAPQPRAAQEPAARPAAEMVPVSPAIAPPPPTEQAAVANTRSAAAPERARLGHRRWHSGETEA